MKNLLLTLLALSTAVLAFLCIQLSQRNRTQVAQLTALQAQSEQLETQLQDLKKARTYSENQSTELSKAVQSLGAQLKKAQAAQSSRPPGATPTETAPGGGTEENGGFGKLLANMMKDPDTRKFIRDQQRTTLEQLYGPLMKKLALTPEEADRFKELLLDNAMQGAGMATSLFGGGATNRSEVLGSLASEQKKQEELIKDFLGDARYEQYKDYQQTAGERSMLNMFRMQNGGSENPISEAQTEQLLAIMREEKQALPPGAGLAPGNDAANLQKMLSEDQADKMLEAQQTVNQRVYQRASGLLNTEQLQAFSRFQSNQMQMMRMGMSMARKFMGGEKPAQPPQ